MLATITVSVALHLVVGIYVLFASPPSPSHKLFVLNVEFIEPEDDSAVISQMPPLTVTQQTQKPVAQPTPVSTPAPMAEPVRMGSQERKVKAPAFFVGGDTESDPQTYALDMPGATQIYATPSGTYKVALVKAATQAQQYAGQRWFISERPPGSKVQLLAKNKDSVLSFKPDVPGRYKVGVVGEGPNGDSQPLMAVVSVGPDGLPLSPDVAMIPDDPATEDPAAETAEEPEESDGNLQAVITPQSHDRVCDSTEVQLDGTSSGSSKYTSDQLMYHWTITSEKSESGELEKYVLQFADTAKPRFQIKDKYDFWRDGYDRDEVKVTLRVTDPEGNFAITERKYRPSYLWIVNPVAVIMDDGGWVPSDFSQKYPSDDDKLRNINCEFRLKNVRTQKEESFQRTAADLEVRDGHLWFPAEKYLRDRNQEFQLSYKCYPSANPGHPAGYVGLQNGFLVMAETKKTCGMPVP